MLSRIINFHKNILTERFALIVALFLRKPWEVDFRQTIRMQIYIFFIKSILPVIPSASFEKNFLTLTHDIMIFRLYAVVIYFSYHIALIHIKARYQNVMIQWTWWLEKRSGCKVSFKMTWWRCKLVLTDFQQTRYTTTIKSVSKYADCILAISCTYLSKNGIRELVEEEFVKKLQRPGIEPGPPAWQARILPLNQRCLMTLLNK